MPLARFTRGNAPAWRARPTLMVGALQGLRFPTWLPRGPPLPIPSPSPGAGEERRAVASVGTSSVCMVPEGGEASTATEEKPRGPRPFPPLSRPLARSLSGAQRRGTGTPLGCAHRSPQPGQQLAPAVHLQAGRGNPGTPLGPGAVAARPRPGPPARAYRGRPPDHAEWRCGIEASAPRLLGVAAGQPGRGGGWRVEIGAGGPRQPWSRVEQT